MDYMFYSYWISCFSKIDAGIAGQICWKCLFFMFQVLFGFIGLCLIGHN